MGKKTQIRKLNEAALDEAHYILSEAYTELEPIPEACQGIAQALDLARHHEALHRENCQSCQKGQTCPSLLTMKEISSRLTLALEIISRYADLQLEYIRDAVGVIGQELYGADERNLIEKERPRLTVLPGKSREKADEEGEDEPAS